MSKSNFVDPEFPHTTASLFGAFAPPRVNHVLSWKRPIEFVKGDKKLALFKDGSSAGDVIQGALGDCWFLGAMSCVGTREDLTGPMFVEADVEKGKYVVRFWKGGEWRFVTVDDYLPCNAKGVPAYAQSADLSELWVMIAEKAYAKLHGCYAAIESGSVADGLVELTGGAPEELDLSTDEGKAKFWPTMMRFIEENWLMGCGFSTEEGKDHADDHGIIPNHAYGILKAMEVDGHRLIQVRNPWGMKEWTGDWSDNSPLWTPQLKKKLELSDANDGVFWMCEKDFVTYFNRFYGSRLYEDKFGKQWQHISVKGRFSGKSAGGCVNHQSWIYNPQYCISVPTPDTDLYICMSQPDIRLLNAKTGEKNQFVHKIGFCIFNTDDGSIKKAGEMNNDQIVLKSVYTNVQTVTADIKLLPGKQYIFMPSTFDAGIELDYNIDIYADEDITLKQIAEPEETEIQGEWSGASAGGCINHPTYKDNPQYYFFVKEKCKINLTLFQEVEAKDDPTYISLFLYQADAPGEPRRLLKHTKDIWRTNLINARQVGGLVELEASDRAYIAIPSTKDPGVFRKFRLHVQGNTPVFSGFKYCLPWNEVKVSGTWAGLTAGGCRNHPTWRNNPMFALSNVQGADLNVTLTLNIGKEAQGTGVGMYIAPKAQKSRRLEATKDEIKAPFVANQSSVTFKCTSENNVYLVIPTTFDANVNAPFTLTAFSDGAVSLSQISDAKNFIAKVTGGWTTETAGGSSTEKTWVNNPSFKIEFDNEVDHDLKDDEQEIDINFLLVTKRPAPTNAIGLTILKASASGDKLALKHIAAKSPFMMNDYTMFPTKVKNGQFLMPMIKEAGVVADFSIYAYAGCKVKLTPKKE